MDTKTQTEELLAGAISPTPVSRDEVRQWVMTTRSQIRRRARFATLAKLLGFFIMAMTIWFSMQHQANQVRQLVTIQPAKSMVVLEEITQELCQSPPADYFVQQFAANRKRHSVLSATTH